MDETILIVSRDPAERDRLADAARPLGLKCWMTSTREGAVQVVRDHPVALVIGRVDSAAGEDAGWLRQLWAERADVPVVFVGPDQPVSLALEALRAGALEFLRERGTPEELTCRLAQAVARRERWLEERRWRGALEQTVTAREAALHGTYRQVLEALGAALDTRHPETQDHTRRVVDESVRIARVMGVAGEELRQLEWGAALHDVGKIGIPDAVLLKPAALTPDEWATMKSHCEIGYRMLAGVSFLRSALPIVLHHHERFDGRGYPFGLTGEEIPFGARIFAVADAYDAMTSDRPYRPAMSTTSALGELIRCSGSQFDPSVVRAFVNTTALSQALHACAA